jgi:GNAT superfamily N-acetyltransferase
MRLVRVSASHLWQLESIERSPEPSAWASQAESFMLDGRAAWLSRQPGAILLAAHDIECVGAGLAYPDPTHHDTMRLAAIVVSHRHRGFGVGTLLLGSMIEAAQHVSSYVIWLVHQDNAAMLHLSRRHHAVADEAEADDGYIAFFAQ